ncbi:MAG: Hypothetical protein AJITA_00930 [Acetilactobacillus jinshanensis]
MAGVVFVTGKGDVVLDHQAMELPSDFAGLPERVAVISGPVVR